MTAYFKRKETRNLGHLCFIRFETLKVFSTVNNICTTEDDYNFEIPVLKMMQTIQTEK